MTKLNNKGQVLVCFVIMIPILFFIISLILNIGLYNLEKRKITNTLKDTLKYGLEHIDNDNISDKMKSLISANTSIPLSSIDIIVDNGYIKISVDKKYDGVMNFKNDEINVSLIGNVDNKNIREES